MKIDKKLIKELKLEDNVLFLKNLLQKSPKKLSVNVQTNSANFGFNFFDKYKKCFYLSLDEPEARYGLQDRSCDSTVFAIIAQGFFDFFAIFKDRKI